MKEKTVRINIKCLTTFAYTRTENGDRSLVLIKPWLIFNEEPNVCDKWTVTKYMNSFQIRESLSHILV